MTGSKHATMSVLTTSVARRCRDEGVLHAPLRRPRCCATPTTRWGGEVGLYIRAVATPCPLHTVFSAPKVACSLSWAALAATMAATHAPPITTAAMPMRMPFLDDDCGGIWLKPPGAP